MKISLHRPHFILIYSCSPGQCLELEQCNIRFALTPHLRGLKIKWLFKPVLLKRHQKAQQPVASSIWEMQMSLLSPQQSFPCKWVPCGFDLLATASPSSLLPKPSLFCYTEAGDFPSTFPEESQYIHIMWMKTDFGHFVFSLYIRTKNKNNNKVGIFNQNTWNEVNSYGSPNAEVSEFKL